MGVELPGIVVLRIEWCLMSPHRIWKLDIEQVVISREETEQEMGQVGTHGPHPNIGGRW